MFVCTCLYPPILASSYPYVCVYLLVSSHPRIFIFLCICVHACIFASLHPHILRFMRPCLHHWILISLGSCVLASNLVSSHSLILRLMYSVCLLISSHPHILKSWGSSVCTCLGNWNQIKTKKMASMETNNGSNKFLTK